MKTLDTKPKVTIVTPVFNEEDSLDTYVTTVKRVLLDHPDYFIRVLFIEDGSHDASWQRIMEINRADSRFSGVRLSRNFGSHVALSAGIDLADGDAVATLACDLQDPPATILEFLEKWRQGNAIVWGHRRTRQDSNWRAWTSNAFRALLRRYAMPKGSLFTTGSFLLMDRIVVDCFRKFREQNRITFALVAWTGFDQAVVHYDRLPRVSGKSGWSFSKMIKTMYDAFIGFSLLPVRIITWAGLTFFLLSILITLYLVLSWGLGHPVPGWHSLMASMSLLFGLVFMMLGILAEYLSRIYSEVVNRPLYFISQRTDAQRRST